MEFSVLGPLQITDRGAPVPLTRRKGRALLGLLLARMNWSIPTDQLIDELWTGHPPPSADSALRVHVSQLRAVLASGCSDGAQVLEATPGGYRLSIRADDCDAVRFEVALHAAREALRAGAPGEAADQLEPALGWWRGAAYSDVRDLEALRMEGMRLDGLRTAALEVLSDAYLALDRLDAASGLLVPGVAEHPLHEGLAERLMLTLYRLGRQAEALRVYSRLRVALEEELGVPPGPSIRAVEEAIVLQQPEPATPRAAPRVAQITAPASVAFVGRRAEASAVDRAWDEASTGHERLVLISGPAGIGKTTLAERVARRVEENGGLVLVGHCDPDPASDYEPFHQVLRKAVDAVSADTLGQPVFAELVRLLPDCADRLAPLSAAADDEAGRYRLFVAISTLLNTIGSVPVLIVTEDLHWAGRDALALLRHVVREVRGRVMVLGTYRADEELADTPRGRARSEGQLARPDLAIALHGLGAAELDAFVRSAAPPRLRDPLLRDAAALHELTGGNPLFVHEVMLALDDESNRTALEDLAPGGVRTLVERRLTRLEPDARALVSVCAVLGREFDLSTLAATASLTEAQALEGLDELLESGLVVAAQELDHFTFSHPLLRNVIYQALPHSRRARVHLDAGIALQAELGEHEHGRWAEPARHFLAALPLGGADRAATMASRAGDDAAARFAHTEAVKWYRSALALSAEAQWTPLREATTLLALGQALERAGEREGARFTYVQAAAGAQAAGAHELLADIAVAATPRYVTVDEFRSTQAALVDAALAVVDDDQRRRAGLLCCAGASRYYDEPGDAPYAVQALELARCSPDARAQALGLTTYHRFLTHDAAAAAERLALSREILSICRAEHLDDLVGGALRTLLVDCLQLGLLTEFDHELEVFAQLAAEHSIPADIYWASALRATRALMCDPHGDTEELVRAARTLGRRFEQTDAEGTFILQTFVLRYEQGRAREVAAELEAPAADQPRMLAGLALLAAVFVAAGRGDAARPILDRVTAGGQLCLPRDNLWLGAVGLLCGVAAAIGTAQQLDVFAVALAPFADHWCVFGAGGAVMGTGHHWLGRLAEAAGSTEEAAAHFVHAWELSVAASAGYWADVAATDLERVGSPTNAPSTAH